MAVATGVAVGVAAAATIGAAAISSSAAKKAARTQQQAAGTAAEAQVQAQEIATEELRRQYDISREDLAPYRAAGTEALTSLRDLMQPGGYLATEFQFPLSEFEADPGYQFRLSEGMKALERSAAARGGVLSGRQLKDITRYGQEYAAGEYGNVYARAFNAFMQNRGTRFNRLASLAGLGQTATATGAQIGAETSRGIAGITTGTGTRISDIALQAGNIRAAGQIGAVSPYANALSSLGGGFQQYLMLQQMGLLGGGRGGVDNIAPYAV